MMSYDGTDAVNHLFAPFHPPYRDGVSQDGYRRYWPAVANYYSEVDRLIGEWTNVLPRDTTVIIMSAYGLQWGKARPHEPPNGGATLPGPQRYQRGLQAIGHMNDPTRAMASLMEDQAATPQAKPIKPERWGIYAYYNNLGVDLRSKGKLKEASDAFEQAVELNPARPVPYLNLAMALFDRQAYSDANDVFFQAVQEGLRNPD